jgi:hypothetical protein
MRDTTKDLRAHHDLFPAATAWAKLKWHGVNSVTTYSAYCLMLLVPVLLTVVVFGSLKLFGDGPPLGEIAFALLALIGIAGVPYIVLATGFAAWANGRPDHSIRRAANLAPLIFWLFVLVNCTWTVGLQLPRLGWISVLVLGTGYLWVMLAHVVVAWLRVRKIIPDAV